MNRAVFDTNVIGAGFLSPTGPPGRLVEWLRNGSVKAVLDDRIIAEYEEVLARPLFGLPKAEVDLVLAAIQAQAFWIEVLTPDLVQGLPDPDDAPFLECAKSAGVPLVTGNTRHFPKPVAAGVRIISPAQFVALIGKEES